MGLQGLTVAIHLRLSTEGTDRNTYFPVFPWKRPVCILQNNVHLGADCHLPQRLVMMVSATSTLLLQLAPGCQCLPGSCLCT